MDTKTILPITEARKKIFNIADQVQKTGLHYTLTEKGVPKAVIMSAEEYESLQETIEVLRDPKLMKEIKTTDKDIKRGNYTTLEEVLIEEGYVVKDKKKTYVSSRSKKKCSKKS